MHDLAMWHLEKPEIVKPYFATTLGMHQLVQNGGLELNHTYF